MTDKCHVGAPALHYAAIGMAWVGCGGLEKAYRWVSANSRLHYLAVLGEQGHRSKPPHFHWREFNCSAKRHVTAEKKSALIICNHRTACIILSFIHTRTHTSEQIISRALPFASCFCSSPTQRKITKFFPR